MCAFMCLSKLLLWLQLQIQLSVTIGLAIVFSLPALLPIQLCKWWPWGRMGTVSSLCVGLPGGFCPAACALHIQILQLFREFQAVRMNGRFISPCRVGSPSPLAPPCLALVLPDLLVPLSSVQSSKRTSWGLEVGAHSMTAPGGPSQSGVDMAWHLLLGRVRGGLRLWKVLPLLHSKPWIMTEAADWGPIRLGLALSILGCSGWLLWNAFAGEQRVFTSYDQGPRGVARRRNSAFFFFFFPLERGGRYKTNT